MSEIETVAKIRSFGGTQGVYRHRSDATGTPMEFSVYVPPQAADGPCPVVTWLSGLTCTWENATTKAGFQGSAAEAGLVVVCPDTSPRGLDLPGEHASYDFGSGAGFYVDATEPPWSANYRMYHYVTEELPAIIAAHFPVDPARQGIFGHSMGGHGALTVALKNPGTYRSVSAFAPICSPMNCPWGEKALTGYLGPDRATWRDGNESARGHALDRELTAPSLPGRTAEGWPPRSQSRRTCPAAYQCAQGLAVVGDWRLRGHEAIISVGGLAHDLQADRTLCPF